MNRKMEAFLKKLKKQKRKRFNLLDMEMNIIEAYKGKGLYEEKGGYIQFAQEMNRLKAEGRIVEISSSDYNGLNPPLKLRWELVVKEEKTTWDESKMLRLSNYLEFGYYRRNPKYQSPEEWEYIENIYGFIKMRDDREWASVEERSLELFYDEKFISDKKDRVGAGRGILQRLGIGYEDLKMKDYGEMFIYWNRGVERIRKVIILENHSTFITYKRIAERGQTIFGFHPDILIYGGGNKIERSFSFLQELGNPFHMEILYFGDIDSEGFGIYKRLKARYPDIQISLQREAYTDLIALCQRSYPRKSQVRNSEYLDYFIDQMGEALSLDLREKLLIIWEENLRIPQELINYEYLLRVISYD